jgi:hypothetical protein
MMSLKSILQPILNWKFIIGYVASLVLLLPIYLLHLNVNVTILTFNINFLSILQITILCISIYLIKIGKFEENTLGILSGVASLILAFYFRSLMHTFTNIAEWDFMCFYLNGKATVEGLSLYDPTSFANVLSNVHLTFNLSDSFYSGAIQTGVIYPPTTMLLLAPLGYLDVNTANIVWKIFVLTFMAIDVILLYRIFKIHESNWMQLLFIVLLILIFPGSRGTLDVSQTNFFILFLLLLIYKDPDNWKAGIYLAIAIIVKPIPVVWALYFLINKKWKPLFSFIIAGMVIVLLSIMQLGFNNFMTYFTSPPVLRIPPGSFSEDINQSINAVFSRISLQLGLDSVLQHMNVIVLIVTLILVILTCIASYKLANKNPKFSFLIFLPLSLLIFPGTLTHYAVQLIPLFLAMILIKDRTSLIYFSIFLIITYFSLFIASLIILSVIIIYTFLNIQIFTKLEIKRDLSNPNSR